MGANACFWSMKSKFLGIVCVLTTVCASSQTVRIPVNQTMLLTGGGPGQDACPAPQGHVVALEASITNVRGPIEVMVWDANRNPVRGFGLGRRGKATVYIGPEERLLVRGPESRKGKVRISYSMAPPPPPRSSSSTPDAIQFTLTNPSPQSIPLEIPGVMNPNLSPNSRSGVALRPGQALYWSPRPGKRVLIYEVPSELAPGCEVNVAALVAAVK